MSLPFDNLAGLQNQYPHLADSALAVLKSTIVISLSAAAAGFFRRQSALARNWIWRSAIIGLLGVAFWEFAPQPITQLHPVWHVIPTSKEPPQSIQAPPRAPSEITESASDKISDSPQHSPSVIPRYVARQTVLGFLDNKLRTIWYSGIVILLLWRGLRTVAGYSSLNKSASPASSELLELTKSLSASNGWNGSPRLAICLGLDTPLLAGWLKPCIFLPPQSTQWNREKLEAVLLHELAHWQRRDGWWQTLAAVAQSIWWWNPLAAYATRQMKTEAEQAADEIVVLAQSNAPNYAQVLVEIAAGIRQGDNLPGIAMAGQSSLEIRIRAILRDNPWRGKLGHYGLGAAVFLMSLFLGVGAIYLGVQKADAASATPGDKSVATLTSKMLDAAATGDPLDVNAALDASGQLRRPVSFRAIQQSLDNRNLLAFTTMFDVLQTTPFGKDWTISDDSLAGLVKTKRTDFLDALLARSIDLNRLAAQAKIADATTAAWITRRIAEEGKRRADIEDLCKAARNGDLLSINRLLAARVDVNCVGKDHNTPLIRAVFNNQLQAAQLLLDKGADIEKPRFPGWNYTPLCLVNTVPMAELLKKNGANINAKLFSRDVSILSYVAATAKPDVVAWFLKQGLDPKKMSDEGDGEGSLLFNLDNGDTAKLLLDAGVDPNQVNRNGITAIFTAQSAAVAKALIDHGAKLTGFKTPLLLAMVNRSTPGAMAVVLKASKDHDPIEIQSAYNELQFRGDDPSGTEQMRQLLITYGARTSSRATRSPFESEQDITVSTANGEFTGDGGTVIKMSFTDGSGGSQQSTKVEPNGTAPVWIQEGTRSISLVALRKGWAPAFVGPLTPPLDQKLKDAKFLLGAGTQPSVSVADEQGQPIPGANIRPFYQGWADVDAEPAATNSAGIATLQHIASAPLNLQVQADGYQADEIDNIHFEPGKPYRWILKKAAITNGIVVDATSGKPVAGATVKLAGVLGPRQETHGSPDNARVLATTDAQGRFALSSLRPDSVYFLFVDAKGHAGQFVQNIKAGQPELKVTMGPELTVHGKVIHFAHISPDDVSHDRVMGGYDQSFNFGNTSNGTGWTIELNPVNDEAEFTIGPLYAWPVRIQIGGREINLQAKQLPKADLLIDLASAPSPAP